MKQIIVVIVFLGLFVVESLAQIQYTEYDDFPGINKIYKPGYEESYTGWKKMLYQFPVNFVEINSDFNQYMEINKGERTPIVKYYKLWRSAVLPYTDSNGTIQIPDIEEIKKELVNTQKSAYIKTKSASVNNSDWTLWGPKGTYYLNQDGIQPDRLISGVPKQIPMQANVYYFDVAETDRSILYCGTETGYVNKTTDKGLTWKQVGKDYVFGTTIEAVLIHPKDPNIVYVSSSSKQLHKTTDGGITWAPILPADLAFTAIQLKISPANDQMMFAASSDGLFLSKDGGSTWLKKWHEPVYDVDFNAADPTIVYCLSKNDENNFRFQISTDSGETFHYDSNFPLIPEKSGGLLAVTKADPNIVYVSLLAKENDGDCVYILKGTKNGDVFDWIQTKKSNYRPPGPDFDGMGFNCGWGYFDLIFEASQVDPKVLIFGTLSAFKSTDGGYNFIAIGGYAGPFNLHPDIQCIKMFSSGETWISTDGGINYSTDVFTSTNNYSSRTFGIVGSDMWGFDQGWNEDIIVGGRYHNGNAAITDFYGDKSLSMGGGESPTGWVLQGKSRHVAFDDSGNWILPKTAEGKPEGHFVFSKFPNMDEYGGRRGNLVHHPNYYSTIFLGEGNGFWKSADYGASFELLYQFPNRVRYLQISHKNPDVIYADIVANGLYRSSDGGKSWVRKPTLTYSTNGGSLMRGNMFFAISPYNENRLYACLAHGGFVSNVGKVFYSNDGGDTWTNWTDGIDAYTKCLAVQPTKSGKDLVYLFTSSINGYSAKIFSRLEDQANWENFDNNYPPAFKVNTALPFYRDAKLRVAGNAGVWESPLAETDFAPVVNPWVESSTCDCAEKDTLYFDDHSILNHSGASWSWEITPEPAYISNREIRNPKVVLGNVGAYDVKLTVTQDGMTYSKTIPKMVTAKSCPTVYDCGNPAKIDKTLWSVMFVDSEETGHDIDGKVTNLFDGDPNTYWHTQARNGMPAQPHEVQIDLGNEYELSKFIYQPRIGSYWGWIKDYELYVSTSKTNWGTPIVKSSFENTESLKEVSISPVLGRYIKFKTLSAQYDQPYSVVPEIDFVGCIQNGTAAVNFDFGQMEAYPIPAKEQLIISLPQGSQPGVWNYKIISVSGIVIESGQFPGNQPKQIFKLNNCKPGLYFILLESETGAINKVKFVVN